MTVPSSRMRLPRWLRRPIPAGPQAVVVRQTVDELNLTTVCHGARCPNRAECFACGTLTFMILGGICTRDCAFCAVPSGEPARPDPNEPETVAKAARRLGLQHVVITSVTRDDLSDGGADQFVRTIRAVRRRMPSATIEVLTPDFQGRVEALECVLTAGCDVFNHNLETVRRLTEIVRPQADTDRSLGVLARAAQWRGASLQRSRMQIKSGLMLGLGERDDEVFASLRELRAAGCDVLTLGQYLRPGPANVPVQRFVPPEAFDEWRIRALDLGFRAVAAGPWVRSSYHAGRTHAHAAGSAGL